MLARREYYHNPSYYCSFYQKVNLIPSKQFPTFYLFIYFICISLFIINYDLTQTKQKINVNKHFEKKIYFNYKNKQFIFDHLKTNYSTIHYIMLNANLFVLLESPGKIIFMAIALSLLFELISLPIVFLHLKPLFFTFHLCRHQKYYDHWALYFISPIPFGLHPINALRSVGKSPTSKVHLAVRIESKDQVLTA
jgi:hypothetical protein